MRYNDTGWKTQGLIMGLEQLGAVLKSKNDTEIHFTIPPGSKLQEKEASARAKHAFKEMLGLILILETETLNLN